MKNKWMTREEFEKSHRGTWCWIDLDDVSLAFYFAKEYRRYDDFNKCHDRESIKAVIPIEKPEYQKEEG